MRALLPPRTRVWPCMLAAGLSTGACFQDHGLSGPTSGASGTTQPASSSTSSDDATSTSTGVGPTDASSSSSETGAASSTSGAATTGGSTTGECIDRWYLDIDGDGYGGPEYDEGCGPPPQGFTVDSLDCDDTRPKVHPGAEETCDDIDNDCDAGVDEWPAAKLGACGGCEAQLHEDHYYYFCETPELTWEAASARCQLLLADLAIAGSKSEHEYIASFVQSLDGESWLGLSDIAVEDAFVWVDGTPLDPRVDFWAKGEPDDDASDSPDQADCVAIVSEFFVAYWHDQACTSTRPFVCEAAGP